MRGREWSDWSAPATRASSPPLARSPALPGPVPVEIEAMLENLDAAKEGHPTPISVEDAVPRPPKTVSLKEGCFITGLKPDALRALGDRGLVKMALTSGGHRRFERAALERYLDGPRPFGEASN